MFFWTLCSIAGRFVVSQSWKAEGPCLTKSASGSTGFSRFLVSGGTGAMAIGALVPGSGAGAGAGSATCECNSSMGAGAGAELVAWLSFSKPVLK